MNFLLQLIIDGAFAATASLGFGMVFNVPKHTLKYCAMGGAIVYSLRTIFLHFNFFQRYHYFSLIRHYLHALFLK